MSGVCRLRLAKRMRAVGAFTLTELLVIICIIGVLAGLLLPVLSYARERSRTVTCASNLRQLGTAMIDVMASNGGKLPDVYYNFSGSGGHYDISVRSVDIDDPDAFFRKGNTEALTCPNDDLPVLIPGRRTGSEIPISAKASYAYNVALPLLFINQSRVALPAETVSFYDGDIQSITGIWESSEGWVNPSIRPRHLAGANYLYLDGHVETLGQAPISAFENGARWVASARNTGDDSVESDPPDPEPEEEEEPWPDLPLFPDYFVLGAEEVAVGTAADLGTGGGIGSGQKVIMESQSKCGGISGRADIDVGEGVTVYGSIVGDSKVTIESNCTIQGRLDSGGEVTLMDDVTVGGNITTDDKLTLGDDCEVTGDVVCNGDVYIGSYAAISGDVKANGDVCLSENTTVTGSVIYKGSLDDHKSSTIQGGTKQVGEVKVELEAFSQGSLPGASNYISGGPSVKKGSSAVVALEPGSYRSLSLGSDSKLYLSRGAYYFEGFQLGNRSEVYIDCQGGSVQIYVDGEFAVGTKSNFSVTGGNASCVYLEVKGDCEFGNYSRWLGTVYSLDGAVWFGENSVIHGAVFAKQKITIGQHSSGSYVSLRRE
jgi:prepilin-type processing-associated H-X9-DG protein